MVTSDLTGAIGIIEEAERLLRSKLSNAAQEFESFYQQMKCLAEGTIKRIKRDDYQSPAETLVKQEDTEANPKTIDYIL